MMGVNLFPRCARIRGMHETRNADWWDARVTFLNASLPVRLSNFIGMVWMSSYIV